MKTYHLSSNFLKLLFLSVCFGTVLAYGELTLPTWTAPEVRENVLRGRIDDVEAGNGILVAVARNSELNQSGDRGRVYISKEGREWTDLAELTDSVPFFDSSPQLCYGNGVFILCAGYHSYISSNGIHWESMDWNRSILGGSTDEVLYMGGVEFLNGKFYGTPTGGAIVVSENGRDWSQLYIPFTTYGITVHPSTGKLFASGYENGPKLFESSNGYDWVPIREGDYRFKTVGNVVVIAKQLENGVEGMQITSTEYTVDGSQWVTSNDYLLGIDHEDRVISSYNIYVAGGDFIRIHSTFENGEAITYVQKSKELGNWTEVARYHDWVSSSPVVLENQVITLGYLDNVSFWSSDNETWEHHWEPILDEAVEFSDLEFSLKREDQSIFVGVYNREDQWSNVSISRDGFEWELATELDCFVQELEYSARADEFYLIGYEQDQVTESTNQQVLISKDGQAWTVLCEMIPFVPQSVVYNGSVWIIFGSKRQEVLVSADDGATWTSELTNQLNGIEWNTPTSSAGVFEDAFLLVESVEETFVLIWDTTIYQSVNGIDWTRVLDVAENGEWFTYLDCFNGRFFASARTYHYLSLPSYPRWDGFENIRKFYSSTDGLEWEQEDVSDRDWFYGTLRHNRNERYLWSKLGEDCGRYYMSNSGFVINEAFDFDYLSSEGRQRVSLSGDLVFGKGRFFSKAGYSSKTESQPLASSAFVGFWGAEEQEDGYKQSNWLGTFDDSNYPMLDHALWGNCEFVIEEDGSDVITIYSDEVGVLSTTRGLAPLFHNELDGNTYEVDFEAGRYTNTETQETSSEMAAESATKQEWLVWLDQYLSAVQQEAVWAIQSYQANDVFNAAVHFRLLEKAEAKTTKYGELLLRRYEGHEGLDTLIAAKMTAIADVKQLAIEQMDWQ